MSHVRLLAVGACALLATCDGHPAEGPLDGLWSRTEAGCAAGIGVRFGGETVTLAAPDRAIELARWPRYLPAGSRPGEAAVRVEFPAAPSTRAVLVLAMVDDGRTLRLVQQRLENRETGSAVVAVADGGGAFRSFDGLRRCVAASDLRGRRDG